jgi:hypothetical protein
MGMKVKIFLGTFILLFINIYSLFAQTNGGFGFPCDDTNIDLTCPLDTWVILLVIAAFIFASYNLYQKQKKSLAK